MTRVAFLLLAACSASSGRDDTRGPFTGPVHRYVIDTITIPSTNDETIAYAGDLDGNGTAENKLGLVMATLASTGDLSTDGPSMIAAGALAQEVTIQADDLANDDSVGFQFGGGDVAGGTLVDGVFRSNRAATTRVPGRAIVQLPIFTNAAPLALPVEGLEVDLADGTAIIRGGVRQDEARRAAYAGLVDMFEHEPERHLVFQRQVDTDRDGLMSEAELADSVIALLATADIQMFDGARYAPNPAGAHKDALSLGFAIHLTACETGRCSTAPPAAPCRDRIKDGDETDIDCGGASCQPCWDARTCSAPRDCYSNACIAGSCAIATCRDGVRDAYESDIDCGSTCAACSVGQVCAADSDCATRNCDNGPAQLGHCI